DPNPANNSAQSATEVRRVADLGIGSLIATPEPGGSAGGAFAAGTHSTMHYQASVLNSGPDDAEGVIFSLVLPPNSTQVVPTAGCFDNAGTVVCELGSIASGGARTIDVSLVPDASGTISQLPATAVVTSGAGFDLEASNNSRSVFTLVERP